jgi:hypothetical protein
VALGNIQRGDAALISHQMLDLPCTPDSKPTPQSRVLWFCPAAP